MVLTDLHQIAQVILDQAKDHGSVVADDVRAQLAKVGQPEQRWKEVIELVRPQLRYSKGRYHYLSSLAGRVRQEKQQQRSVARAIRSLIRNYRKVQVDEERRQHQRVPFLLTIKVRVHDEHHEFVCQDVSLTGIRFLGDADLRGQVVKLIVPTFDNGGGQWTFTVRVLWSNPAGKLFVQGGVFLAAEAN
ncbi:MAG: PilZ domain-containing protein [Gemmataceae bacterium]